MINQISGLENLPIMFIPEQNLQTNIPDLKITQEQINRVLNEYQDLKLIYEEKVPLNISENEFWIEFLKKNNKYHTVVFGGSNPLFIPFGTDETKYLDSYYGNNVDVPAGDSKDINMKYI